jgi:enoyl-CoA hydratase
MADSDLVLYAVDPDGILTLTLNRPDKLNALSHDLLSALGDAVHRAAADDQVKAVVLTGAGSKSFVAGADIGQFSDLDADSGRHFAERGQQVFSAIENLPKAVVAAVNGYALGGGCELAMACHLRVASERAVFGQPEVGLGIIPGYGGTQRLPRLVGLGIATELVLTGAKIDAQRAHAIGLVNHIVPHDETLEAAKKLARSIAVQAPVAVRLTLEALRHADRPLAEGLAEEARLFGQSCATEDVKEGASAFLEKRRPTWAGR